MTNQSPIALVCMPWGLATRPSVALGILRSVLDREQIDSCVHSFHLSYAELAVEATQHDTRPITLERYEDIANSLTSAGGGDWAFAVSPYREPDEERDNAYLELLAEKTEADDISDLVRLRALAPAFLEDCCAKVLAYSPKIVGFTSTFCQNVPSLALAMMLKAADPGVKIVFGGSNCEGPMGAALLDSFSCIDVVVRGEGESVFPQVVRALLAGAPVPELAGVCFREGEHCMQIPEAAPSTDMDRVPIPNYDEYFARLAESPIASELRALVKIPYESARGCWWGAKHHCTFCGLNGAGMAFRSKSASRVTADLAELARRYEMLDFYVVDNIIDMSYFDSLLPELSDAAADYRLFFETKSNLKREQVALLHAAGVRLIQPGIESLSSPILRLMRKGVTGLQNVRLLKLCAEYEISVFWNVIYGFPGEDAAEYAEMAGQMESLFHLAAPNCTRLRVDRFSPYFERGEELGLRVTEPLQFYHHIYDVADEARNRLAYFFQAEYLDGRDPDSYIKPVQDVTERWRAATADAYRKLWYLKGPGFVVVHDQRPNTGPARYVLEDVEAQIYLAAEEGATAAAIAQRVGHGLDAEEVREFLDELADARLVYREGQKYLALAIAPEPPRFSARVPGARSALRRGLPVLEDGAACVRE